MNDQTHSDNFIDLFAVVDQIDRDVQFHSQGQRVSIDRKLLEALRQATTRCACSAAFPATQDTALEASVRETIVERMVECDPPNKLYLQGVAFASDRARIEDQFRYGFVLNGQAFHGTILACGTTLPMPHANLFGRLIDQITKQIVGVVFNCVAEAFKTRMVFHPSDIADARNGKVVDVVKFVSEPIDNRTTHNIELNPTDLSEEVVPDNLAQGCTYRAMAPNPYGYPGRAQRVSK